ncbi:hypothetical protein PG987_000577 [Apiospora arundinis]
MDEGYGELYVSWATEHWRHGCKDRTRRVGMYTLGRADEVAEFCRHAKNINHKGGGYGRPRLRWTFWWKGSEKRSRLSPWMKNRHEE